MTTSPDRRTDGSAHAPEAEDDQGRKALQSRDRVMLYARGLSVPPAESVEIIRQSLKEAGDNPSCAEAMEALRRQLHSRDLAHDMLNDAGQRLLSAPAMNRRPMVAEPLERHPVLCALGRGLRAAPRAALRVWRSKTGRRHGRAEAPTPAAPAGSQPDRRALSAGGDNAINRGWERTAHRRRLLLLALIIVPSLLAARTMYTLLPHKGSSWLELAMTVLFAVLFGWISVGFWSAAAGVLVVARRVDRFRATPDTASDLSLPDATARTALLFPVYNEDVSRFMAGIRTVWQSLRATGMEDRFDIFILSDSTNPEAWIEEEEAWYHFCREEGAFRQVFYRRRRNNIKRKSGNIADFCRRWGASYRYMIVFDADSLMAGSTLIRMVQAMEAHPEIGILQTPPRAVNGRTLIARVQQFANHLYGPIFAAGLHYWQLGDAQYWGHNAIIRVEPFMRYCQLPTLPGKGPLGGEILSHDFVEAALMRRGGYSVWLAYDLDGSYEESPPSLMDELIRDRRWCQGNLQHSHLVFARGIFPTHRALFVNGIMSYGSALLWFLFLLCSSLQALVEILVPPTYFADGPGLFPVWPTWYPNWALTLLGSTAVLLFLPKLMALVLVTCKGGAARFGGLIRMTASVAGEVAVSTFLAPVRMLFHSFFVVTTLLGWRVNWNAQNRDDTGTSWSDAFRFHWWGTALGLVWGWLMWVVNPGFFWWLSPIAAGLALSVPLSVWTSRVSWGMAAGKAGLFLTPDERNPSPELVALAANARRPLPYSPFSLSRRQGFIRAVVIPEVHALHLALSRHRGRPSAEPDARLRALVDKAAAQGPDALTRKEKAALLSAPVPLHELHKRVWDQEDSPLAARWGVCLKEDRQDA